MTSESLLGESFGRYQTISKLGKGGMGEVYLAEDSELERKVAIKVLLPNVAADEERVRRFVREAKAASALNHPNILTVHEIGNVDQTRYIVTEYIRGETLRDRLHREPVSLRETLDVTLQVAAALSAAHGAHIVHRDIKPENLMLRDDGFVKVLDFGLAKLSDTPGKTADPEDATRAQVNTAPGSVMGTADYMSPEQARGKETDARTDVWSLGVVLYEMLTGRSPFRGETTNDTIAAILTKEPPPLDEDIPHELHRIIKRVLQKEADDRYQTVQDFLLDVRDLKRELEFSEELERSHIPSRTHAASVGLTASGESPTTMHPDVSTQNSLTRQPSSAEYIVSEIKQRKRGVLGLLGVLLVAVIGAGAYFFWFAKPATAAIKSVAVLPFVNASGDAEQEYLSDGISEEVINNLSELKDLKVIARSSTYQYKGKEIDLDEVARKLGVEAVVTGRVVKRGDQLQISAELVKVSDKSQLWGETFNRKASDASGLEAEISKQIAERLKQRLTNAEQQQLAKGTNVSPQAHDLYLRGIFINSNSGDRKDKAQKAIDLFKQAIAIEPTYALPYTGLSRSYMFLIANGLLDPKDGMPKAEEALKKALELDDALPEAYAELGKFKTFNWKWGEAEQAFKRALELNPNLAKTHAAYGTLLDVLGRHEEAIVHIQKAVELDPAVIQNRGLLGLSMHLARRYDESIDLQKKTLALDPELSTSHSYMGYAYAAKGQYEQAIAEFKESMRIGGVNTSDQCYMAAALARAGRRDEALTILRELENSKEYVSPTELATLYVGLGEKEKAFASLEKAFEAHDLQMQFLGVDPAFDDLRSDPRFNDLLRRVGLPQAQ